MSNLTEEQISTLHSLTDAASSYALGIARTAKSLIDTAVRIQRLAQTARESGLVDDHIVLLEQSKAEIHHVIDDAMLTLNGATKGDFFEVLDGLHDAALAGINAGLDSDIELIERFDDSVGVEDDEPEVDLEEMSGGDPNVRDALVLITVLTGEVPHGWEPLADNAIRVYLNEEHTAGVDAFFQQRA